MHRRLGLALVCALTAALGFACATAPGATSNWGITSVKQRGVHLDVRMDTGSQEVRFFFPAGDDTCQEILKKGNKVQYVVSGPVGSVRYQDLRCDPIGIGSIDWWRSRSARPQAPPSPRSTARFQAIYQDEEVAMVRGRIPFTGLVNWSGGEDTIAVLPLDTACRPLLERGEASIEFRASGRIPLRLISSGQTCEIQGLIRP